MARKTIIFLLVLSSIALARFSNQNSAFVVERDTLYCYDDQYKSIKEYKNGEVISSYYVINYCSYNKETVENIVNKYKIDDYLKKEKKEKLDELVKNVGYIFFYILLGIAILLVTIAIIIF